MSVVTSHLVAFTIALILGIWLGRRTGILAGFIKGK